MATKLKEVSTSTLEARFKKLHDAANFAEESCKAIAEQADELKQFDLSVEQLTIIENLESDIELWRNKFARLATQMQEVESQYWNNLTEDKSKCVLIEEIPTYPKGDIPSIEQMEIALLEIGHGVFDDEAESSVQFSREEILSNIKEFRMNTVLCIKALTFANYKGIWKPVEKTVFDIYEFEPANNIARLLKQFESNE